MTDTERYYPPITEDMIWPIQVVLQQLHEDPEFLQREDCPYPEAVKSVFGQLLEAQQSDGGVDLEGEAQRLYKELKDFGEKLDPDDTSQSNTYFRVSVSLMEKLIAIQERAAEVKRINQFKKAVLDVMENVLDKDQRAEVMNRLKENT